MLATKRVTSPEDVSTIASLAREIWTEHFTPIIGSAQVEYMLRTIQSPTAITQQIRGAGYEYWLATDDDSVVGYFATVPATEAGEMQLSKLYLRRSLRRRGLGKALIGLVEERCDALGIARLWLTVNKDNAASIEFYERLGFVTEASIVTDIGGGFVMDDYRMTKGVGAGFRG